MKIEWDYGTCIHCHGDIKKLSVKNNLWWFHWHTGLRSCANRNKDAEPVIQITK